MFCCNDNAVAGEAIKRQYDRFRPRLRVRRKTIVLVQFGVLKHLTMYAFNLDSLYIAGTVSAG